MFWLFYASKHRPQIEISQLRLQANHLWVWMLMSPHSPSSFETSPRFFLTCDLQGIQRLKRSSVPEPSETSLQPLAATASRNFTKRESLRFLESTSVKSKPARCGPDPCVQPLTADPPGNIKQGGATVVRSHGLGEGPRLQAPTAGAENNSNV